MPHSSLYENLSKEEEEALQARLQLRWNNEVANSRLSLPFPIRLPLATGFAFIGGMALGMSHGSQTAGLRFRAENAHRLPTTPTDWYFYHKAKNYQMGYEALKDGFKLGSKLAFWVTAYFALEQSLDDSRGQKDFFSSVVASLAVAGGFSLRNKFDAATTARMAKKGLAYGLIFGLSQDAVGYARGRPLDYVDWIASRRSKQEQGVDVI